ncbi:MAG: hypothetical protein NDI73_06260 [Desulfuromonadales bacterium]|nr:hypothetical protein [Desulfuromonadales bacterium]
MDATELLVTFGGIALIVMALWFFFGKRTVASPPAGGEGLYACPMHPWITSATVGTNCSVCGMALVRQDKG